MVNREFLAPCGLYCGVCGVMMAQRDGNHKFRAKLAEFYGCRPEDLVCEGCQSEVRAIFCRICHIRACTEEKKLDGCHRCEEWPCHHILDFPVSVGQKVIMRAIPFWREASDEEYVAAEERRYLCPSCGYPLFRGAKRCRRCRIEVDLD